MTRDMFVSMAALDSNRMTSEASSDEVKTRSDMRSCMDIPRAVSLLRSFPGFGAELESSRCEVSLQATIRHIDMLQGRLLTVAEREA